VTHTSRFALIAVLAITAGTAQAQQSALGISVGPWKGGGGQGIGANDCDAHQVQRGEELRIDLRCKTSEGSQRCASQQHDVYLTLSRSGWGLSTEVASTVTVSIDNVRVGKKKAIATDAENLYISLGPEAAIRTALEHGAVLSIDTGKEVLKYSLTDMQPLLTALHRCLAALDDPEVTKWLPPSPEPVSESPAANSPVASAAEQGLATAQYCEIAQQGAGDFVVYHGARYHELTAEEREGARAYTENVTPCVSLWKARCKPLPLFPSGSTNAVCEIQADYALAQLNNRRELEDRSETYREYNTRADELDRLYKEALDSFFASVQKATRRRQ
jgi:hypothetical protein